MGGENDYPTLVVHIGSGKTGTTSIQGALKDKPVVLRKQKVAYLGLMLEELREADGYAWAKSSAPNTFLSSKVDDEEAEVFFGALMKGLARLRRNGIEKALIINEAFLGRNRRILPLLKRVQDAGVPMEIHCYIRRPDKWATSAYLQFGLKHKSKGPLLTFEQWLQRFEESGDFLVKLQEWEEAFGSDLRVHNFEAAGNVVDHFFSVIGIDLRDARQSNPSPSNAALASWAVFNAMQKGRVFPSAFRRVARQLGIADQVGQKEDTNFPLPPVDELLPTAKQLTKLQVEKQGYLDYVNRLIERSGEPPLEFSQVATKEVSVDPWEMNQLQLRMIFSLAEQVDALQEQVKELSAAEAAPRRKKGST
ncbi:hypothetical protein [Pseudoruegeria sp. SHC-113]|uniref:hypothetical protein n=1 Tax=Pseudoruegeria sp. SHC-113 TaxID=2855439 RepID=UPI0021BA9100|nr:hypothetical protein [Pseudoruegeria sp. SHC-113]MCT8161285.1 hypothetical protein [Pseudoruegeria sp. SHC-113]